MSSLSVIIGCGLGDNILSRLILEAALKDKYTEINIYQNQKVLDLHRHSQYDYHQFLKDVGVMVFNRPPFIYRGFKYPGSEDLQITDLHQLRRLNQQLTPIPRPNFEDCCDGNPLEMVGYICLTTKVRMIRKDYLLPLLEQFWSVLNKTKYKIVLLGEKSIIAEEEYPNLVDQVYCLYDLIKNHIQPDKLIDLTEPRFIYPNIKKLRQDLLIIKNAEQNIVFGEGGNLWMSLAVGNTIAFRQDSGEPFDTTVGLLTHESYHSKTLVTKDWQRFITKLRNDI